MYVINLNSKIQPSTVTILKGTHNRQAHTTLFLLTSNSYSWQGKARSLGNWKSKAKSHNHNKKSGSNQRLCCPIQTWTYFSNKTSHVKFYLFVQSLSNFPQEAFIIFLVTLELLQKLCLFRTKGILWLSLITLMMLLWQKMNSITQNQKWKYFTLIIKLSRSLNKMEAKFSMQQNGSLLKAEQ